MDQKQIVINNYTYTTHKKQKQKLFWFPVYSLPVIYYSFVLFIIIDWH